MRSTFTLIFTAALVCGLWACDVDPDDNLPSSDADSTDSSDGSEQQDASSPDDTSATDDDTSATNDDTSATDDDTLDSSDSGTDASVDEDAADTGEPAPDNATLVFPPGFGLAWEASDVTFIFSSPRLSDLNGDGVLDVVLGHGTSEGASDNFPAYVTAHDGATGDQLWRLTTEQGMFGSAVFLELTGDASDDVVIGGRAAELYAIDGALGEPLWRFDPQTTDNPEAFFNFYTPQLIPDANGDEVPDLLCSNGGDDSKEPGEARPEGHLVIVSGADGALIAMAPMPDGAETYMSPLVYAPFAGADLQVLFGSGGSTLPGSLWMASLDDVLAEDLSSATLLVATEASKGMIAPPSLVDLNEDGTLDIVVSTFDGRVVALDGTGDHTVLWTVRVENGETYGTPAIGDFNGDETVDVFASFSLGHWPSYFESTHLFIDGANGTVRYQYNDSRGFFGSPLAVDLNGDGLDEVLLATSTPVDRALTVHVFDFAPEEPERHELPALEGTALSTFWIGDMDGDDRLEMVLAYVLLQTGDNRWHIERRHLNAEVPAGGVSWGGYLGSDGNGLFR